MDNDYDKTFYCHKCTHFVSEIGSDFNCNNCDSQFVEEIDVRDSDSLECVFAISNGATMATNEARDMQTDPLVHHHEQRQRVPQSTRRRPRSRSEEFYASSSHHFSLMHGLSIPFGIMNALNISDLGEPFGLTHEAFVVNAGDLLSNILTQIFSSSGSMPMSQRNIDRLEKVTINERHIDEKLFCTICIEDFKVNESARKLICDHYFHYNCIAPWLSLHANCPICRKEFTNESGN